MGGSPTAGGTAELLTPLAPVSDCGETPRVAGGAPGWEISADLVR